MSSSLSASARVTNTRTPRPNARLATVLSRNSRSRSVSVKANFLETVINAVSVGITKSPLNEGKKAMAIAQAGVYDEAAIKQKIQDLIGNNPVVMFSFTKCPFCIKAKDILNDAGAKFLPVELDTMDKEGLAIRAELAKMTGRTSMPNVFIAGLSYGGCNDGPGIASLMREGRLVPMLTEAGAIPAPAS